MKLKINIKKSNNLLCEAQAGKIANLRRLISRNSENERDIFIAYRTAQDANNSPKDFFMEIGELSTKLYTKLQKVNKTFPGLGEILSTIKGVSAAAEEDSEAVENAAAAEEDILASMGRRENLEEDDRPAPDSESAKLNRSLERDRREDRARKAKQIATVALGSIDFSNLSKSMKEHNLAAGRELFLRSIGAGFSELAKQGADPVEYVSKNPQVIFDLRAIFHSINLLAEFQKVAVQTRNKIAGMYRQGIGDLESATSEEIFDDARLLNNFKLEFKNLNVEEIIKNGSIKFNNFVLAKLFGASDVAGGGKFEKAQARAKKAGDYASGLQDAPTFTEKRIRGINMLESNMMLDEVSDPEFEEAMRELQTDPLTQTFEEYQQQAQRELQQAASDQSIRNLATVASSIISAFGSYKKLRKERRQDFARRFLEKAREDYNEAESQLIRMVFLIKEPLGDLLEKYVDGPDGIKEKLIGLRRKVKDAREEKAIPPERAAQYISAINGSLVSVAKLRRSYVEQAKEVINNNPHGYLEFLEDVEAYLKAKNRSIVEKIKEDFERIKSGDVGDEEGEGDPGAGAGGKVPQETPLSILKKNKNVRSDSGAVEVPLNAYIQKKLGFSAKSANRLARNIGATLKAKGIPISERQIVDEIYSLIQENNMIDERWESVGAQAEIEGGTGPYHQKLKKANDRLTMLQDKLTATSDPSEKTKIERAIRTVEARKDNLLQNLERVKGEKGDAKTAKNKATRDAEKLGDKFGLVGKIMYKYAARQGEKDPEFMQRFGDNPTAQSQLIKSVRKMLRRQLSRRGYQPIEIDDLMKESLNLIINANMVSLIESINKR